MKDYYQILDLDEEATPDEVQERWRELCKIYHPDILQSPEAEERIREINEAYQTLGDPIKRSDYDFDRVLRSSIRRARARKRKIRNAHIRKEMIAGAAVLILMALGYLFLLPHERGTDRQRPSATQKPGAVARILQTIKPEPRREPEPAPGVLKEAPKLPIPERAAEKPVTPSPKDVMTQLPADAMIKRPLPEPPAPKPEVKTLVEKAAPIEKPPVRTEPPKPEPLKPVKKEASAEIAARPSVSGPAGVVEKSAPEPIALKPQVQAKMDAPKKTSPPTPEPRTADSMTQFPNDLGKERPLPEPPAPKPEVKTLVEKAAPIEKPPVRTEPPKPEPLKPVKKEASAEIAAKPSVSGPAGVVEKSAPEPIALKPQVQAKMDAPKKPSPPTPEPRTADSMTQLPNDLGKEKPLPKPPTPRTEVPGSMEKAVSKPVLQPGAEPATPLPRDAATKKLGPEPPAPPPSTLATENEVKRFFGEYIEVYNRRDLERFLSFFSPKAVQNQKDGMEGIRKVYGKFFGESEKLQYRLAGDAKIDSFADRMEVRARYHIDQTLKRGGEKKVWIGDARWVLVRESGTLKVLFVEYKHQK